MASLHKTNHGTASMASAPSVSPRDVNPAIRYGGINPEEEDSLGAVDAVSDDGQLDTANHLIFVNGANAYGQESGKALPNNPGRLL